jgi:TP901 family phage tail tape measure protein
LDRNLRIRMLLEASEKVTGPLRNIASGSNRTGRALKETRDRLKQLEQAQADIGAFRSLKMGLRTTEAQLGSAQSRVAALAREMDAAETPSRKLARDFDNAKRAASALKIQHEQQSTELQQVRNRMREAGLGADGLVAHQRELRAAIARTNTELQEHGRRLQAADTRARRFAAGRERFSSIQNGATGLAAGGFAAIQTGESIGRPVLGAVAAAQQYQSAMTDIAQKANLSRAEGERMGLALARAARAANQMPADLQAGVDALSGFGLDPREATRMMAPIGRAATAYKAQISDLSAAAFAVSDNLKVPVDQTARVIDVMAAAGKAGAFEMRDMAQYFPALTAGYQALGQKGVPAVADLSAALQIARKGAGDSASAATNVANLLQKITSPATVRAFEKNYGVDLPAALKRAYQEGKTPLEAIAELTQRTLGGDMSKLGYLFEDAQVQQALRPLIANMEEYRRIRAEAGASSGTTDGDFAERMKDSAEKARELKVRAQTLAITLGAQLLPAANRVAGIAVAVADRISAWSQRHPVLAKGIALAIAGLSALFLVVGGGAILIAGLAAPFAALSATAAAFGVGMLPLIGIVGGVVLAITAIGAAAYYIYQNWGAIAGWFGRLWEGIKSVFWAGVEGLGRMLLSFTPQGLFLQGFMALLAWLRGDMAGQLVSAGGDLVRGLIRGITGMLGQLHSTIVNAASSAANWFKAKLGIRSPSRVFAGFGGFMMQGLDRGIAASQSEPVQRIQTLSRELITAFSVGTAATAAMPAAAAPPRAAIAAPAPAPAPAAAARIEIHIHQQPGQSAQDLARAVRAELERIDGDRRAARRSTMLDSPDGEDA